MKQIKDIKIGDAIWRVEQTGELEKGTLRIDYVMYKVLSVHRSADLLYIRTFKDDLHMGYGLCIPVVEEYRCWTKCSGDWFTDLEEFRKHATSLLNEAKGRYQNYIKSDLRSLEDSQQYAKQYFKDDGEIEGFDSYEKMFSSLLDNNSLLISEMYQQAKDAINLHNIILNNLQELILFNTNYKQGPIPISKEIEDMLRTCHDKTMKDLGLDGPRYMRPTHEY